MERMSIPRLIEKLNSLAETFDKKPVSVKAAEMWFEALREFDAELILSLLANWPKTHGKFPVPAELWKACNEIASEEREKRQQREKVELERSYKNFQRTPHGEKMLAIIKGIASAKKITPIQHWHNVLATEGLPTDTYIFARACLKKIDRSFVEVEVEREPGQDDEEMEAA